MKTIIRFNQRNGFAKDITGESGCAKCGHPLEHSAPEKPKDHLMKTHGAGHDCRIDMRGDPECKCETPEPKKHQTIRSHSIEVSTKVALWEMWRGMRKGWYCPKCLIPFYEGGSLAKMSEGRGDVFHKECEVQFQKFPRKLLNTTITACEPILFYWEEDDRQLITSSQYTT